jgi:predicted RNase H-like HicB family nuclease
MQEAIELHLEGMRRSGEPIPEPTETTAEFVDVNV